MKTCYIAGPMRSVPNFNFPAFYAAEGRLVAAGWRVLNPARMDAEDPPPMGLSVEEQRKLADPAGGSAHYYAERDLKAILTLRAHNGDALVVLPGWESSIGARAEVAVARWIGLPILDITEALL